jgi:peptidoglycan hydrolase-like protein with peptidoglycan-binding domain
MKKTLSITLSAILVVIMVVGMAIPSFALTYSGSSSYKSGKYYTALTKVTLTGNQRTDIVNVAKSQIGYQEGGSSSQLSGEVKGSNNYTEYGSWYGLQDMWCHMFVSWCANVAGVSTSIVPKTASTVTGLNTFINSGLAYTREQVANGKYTPQAGDLVYFKSSRNTAITNHVGIVTSYSNSTLYTIEGNTSSATISTNGGAVASKSYAISNTYIVYVCKPNYKTTTTTTTATTQPTTTATTSSSTVSFPTLKSGASGYRVKALQYLLNYYTSAGLTIDGSFGSATTAAVKKFQKAQGLTQDGSVGPNTWAKLAALNQKQSSYSSNPTKAIQLLLNNKNSAGLTVDGSFGSKTTAAVKAFQKAKGITQDGVVGPTTWKYLFS